MPVHRKHGPRALATLQAALFLAAIPVMGCGPMIFEDATALRIGGTPPPPPPPPEVKEEPKDEMQKQTCRMIFSTVPDAVRAPDGGGAATAAVADARFDSTVYLRRQPPRGFKGQPGIGQVEQADTARGQPPLRGLGLQLGEGETLLAAELANYERPKQEQSGEASQVDGQGPL